MQKTTEQIYNPNTGKVLWFKEAATSDYWDRLWSDDNWRKAILDGAKNTFVLRTTQKFLKLKSPLKRRVLEGGCGKGHFVYSLKSNGYEAYGVDFAEKTIAAIQKAMPDLNVRQGDVRRLPFETDFFDGYWSIGVIEHFFSGYQDIIKEMARVIKPGGYLFLTFPHMSPLRKIKAILRIYERRTEQEVDTGRFYQFALDANVVVLDLEKYGFSLYHRKSFDGFKGLKDELPPFLKSLLQKLYESKLLPAQIVVSVLSRMLAFFSGHSVLLVLRKEVSDFKA